MSTMPNHSEYGLYLKECLDKGIPPLSPKDWKKAGSPPSPVREVSELSAPSVAAQPCEDTSAVTEAFATLMYEARKRALYSGALHVQIMEGVERQMERLDRELEAKLEAAKQETTIWQLYHQGKGK
jgi:hypothetical protein